MICHSSLRRHDLRSYRAPVQDERDRALEQRVKDLNKAIDEQRARLDQMNKDASQTRDKVRDERDGPKEPEDRD